MHVMLLIGVYIYIYIYMYIYIFSLIILEEDDLCLLKSYSTQENQINQKCAKARVLIQAQSELNGAQSQH